MKFSLALITLLATTTGSSVLAFTSPQNIRSSSVVSTTHLQAQSNTNVFGKVCATAAMTAFLWGSPTLLAEQAVHHNLPLMDSTTMVANAKEMASGSGSRVNKDAESLLRLGLPIQNKEVKKKDSSLY
jgi:hypothetical protein